MDPYRALQKVNESHYTTKKNAPPPPQINNHETKESCKKKKIKHEMELNLLQQALENMNQFLTYKNLRDSAALVSL